MCSRSSRCRPSPPRPWPGPTAPGPAACLCTPRSPAPAWARSPIARPRRRGRRGRVPARAPSGRGRAGPGLEAVPGTTTSLAAVIVDAAGARQIYIHRGDALRRAHPLDTRQLEGADVVMADTRWPEGAEAALRWAQRHGVPSLLDGDVAAPGVLERLVPLARWVAFFRTRLRPMGAGRRSRRRPARRAGAGLRDRPRDAGAAGRALGRRQRRGAAGGGAGRAGARHHCRGRRVPCRPGRGAGRGPSGRCGRGLGLRRCGLQMRARWGGPSSHPRAPQLAGWLRRRSGST
jgi:hypothetical protein